MLCLPLDQVAISTLAPAHLMTAVSGSRVDFFGTLLLAALSTHLPGKVVQGSGAEMVANYCCGAGAASAAGDGRSVKLPPRSAFSSTVR